MSESITPLQATKRPKASMYQSTGRIVPRGTPEPAYMPPVHVPRVVRPMIVSKPVKTPPAWRTVVTFGGLWGLSVGVHALYYLA